MFGMRRREFISSARRRGLCRPLVARAQQPDPRWRVGVLIRYGEDDTETKARLAAFQQALATRGWVEGRNIRVDYRFAAGSRDKYYAFAKELVALQPDVIIAHTTPVTAALQQESRTIPIVFVNVSDPIGSGFVASLARPGRNLTGYCNTRQQSSASGWGCSKRFHRPLRAGLLANPKTTAYDYFVRSAAVAASLGLVLVASPVETAADVERAVEFWCRTAACLSHRMRQRLPIVTLSLGSPLGTESGGVRVWIHGHGRGPHVLWNQSG